MFWLTLDTFILPFIMWINQPVNTPMKYGETRAHGRSMITEYAPNEFENLKYDNKNCG